MNQENRHGLDQLMKAFDCTEQAKRHFATAGNIEGAKIAQEAQNKVYLSMEAAMRAIRNSDDSEEFAKGGRVVGTYTFAVYTRDGYGSIDPSSRKLVKQRARHPEAARDLVKKKYPGFTYFVEREMEDGGMVEDYEAGGMMSESNGNGNSVYVDDAYFDEDDSVNDEGIDEEFADGGKIRPNYGTWVITDKGVRDKVQHAAEIANIEIVEVKSYDDWDADMFLVRKPSDARKLGSSYITAYGGLPEGGMTTRRMNQMSQYKSFESEDKMELGGQIELPL